MVRNCKNFVTYRGFNIISMMYFALMLFSLIFYKKLIILGRFGPIPISLMISPVFFMMSDLITEVYGFKESRKLLYSSLIILGITALFIPPLINLNDQLSLAPGLSKISSGIGIAYKVIFSEFLKLYMIYSFTVLISDYINIWAISRWKVLLKGRYFLTRSILASFIGLLIYSVLATVLSPYLLNEEFILKIILISFSLKVLFLIILGYPVLFLCGLLKRIERIDVYDQIIDYNSFKLKAPPST